MNEARPNEVRIHRELDAPRALVFANWTEAEHLGAWFAPAGFDVVECSVDLRLGGRWLVVYRSASGELYKEHGEFIEITRPEFLHLTLINEDEHGVAMFRTEVKVTFREQDGKTSMDFVQTGFPSKELRDAVRGGWGTCLDKLDQQLVADREIRQLFGDWSRASERKDLDASMRPVANDVLSYEHESPLAYHGVDALRATCEAGFEHMPEGFRWDVPDLRIVVRGDIAITWGLNHMHGPGVEMWSRGTRVFQKLDGRWRVIHQHVSFPYDPASGAAKLDLRP